MVAAMTRRVVSGAVIVIALVGCGGNDPVTPDAGGMPPDAAVLPPLGEYDEPSDFSRDGCVPGSLAFTAPGIVHGRAAFADFTSTIQFRVDSASAGAIGGRPADRVIITADDVFVHMTIEDVTRSVDLCARDAAGNYTGHYARCNPDGCLLADVTIARRVDRLPEADAQGLSLLGELGGPWEPGLSINVRVEDGIAYLARYGDGLRIIDVSDPTQPTELGHQAVEFPDVGEIWNDVKLASGPGGQRYALMGSDVAGVVVVDVTAPATPSIVAHFGTPPDGQAGINIHTLYVSGGRAYLANSDRGLEIWRVTDPSAPTKLGEWALNGYLHDLFVRGDRAYLNYWGDGMQVLDVTDPASPQLLGAFADYGEDTSHSSWVFDTGGKAIALHGDEQFGAHLRLVDVTENTPGFTQQVGEWQTRPEVSIHNVMALGTLGVIAHYQDGVRVLDLANPAQPQLVAWFNTWPGYATGYGNSFFEGTVGVDVDPVTQRVYVADTHRGLLILALP